MFVVAVDVLFVSSPSAIWLSGSTNALFKYDGMISFGAFTSILIVRTAGTPAITSSVPSIVAPVQSTTPAEKPQVNAPAGGGLGVSAAEMNVAPAGRTSRTATFSAGSDPMFETVSVYVIVSFGATIGVASLWIVRSRNAPLPPLVTSVWADDWLSVSLPSGIVLFGSTMAWLMYEPGVSGANAVSVMFAVPPAGIWPPLHSMNPPAWLQLN